MYLGNSGGQRILLCWGESQGSGSNSPQGVNFPRSFSQNPSVTITAHSGATGNVLAAKMTELNTSHFSFLVAAFGISSPSNGSWVAANVRWIAIGPA
jgi:hypothetical protein